MAERSSPEWGRLRYFRREEFGPYADHLAPEVPLLLDDMRHVIGRPIVIHEAAAVSGHVPGSWHAFTPTRPACAVDCHIVGLSLLDQWLWAERWPWTGIGVYPWWTTPGLHLDLGTREGTRGGRRWWRDAAGQYRALDAAFVRWLVQQEVPHA